MSGFFLISNTENLAVISTIQSNYQLVLKQGRRCGDRRSKLEKISVEEKLLSPLKKKLSDRLKCLQPDPKVDGYSLRCTFTHKTSGFVEA